MKIGVIGASGRMGQTLIKALGQHHELQLAAAIVSADSKMLGKPVADLQYQSLAQLTAAVDVLIDFSLPGALTDNLIFAQRQQLPIVVCTTGLQSEQQQQLNQVADSIPVLHARNTSVGIVLLEQLAALSAAALSAADVEIAEAHHKHKKDAPSGTAIALAEAVARGRQQDIKAIDRGIRGDGERAEGSIGFAITRAADIVGEHQVMLAQSGERLELTHRVSDRKIFADGALQAAQWLQTQAPGFYQMQDMLNLKASLQRLLSSSAGV